MVGFSYGGFGVFNYVFKVLEMFGNVIVMSGLFWWVVELGYLLDCYFVFECVMVFVL